MTGRGAAAKRLLAVLRPLGGALLVLALLGTISPLYRDFFLGHRDRFRGTSPADYLGHLAQDRQVLQEFSTGRLLWNPDKAFGVPRLIELNNRALYPVHALFVRFLPAERAWHGIQLFHACLKALGLILLTLALGWPFWLAVAGSTGAMLSEGSLGHFADFGFLPAAAWFLVQAWLTVNAAKEDRWTGWDSAWVLCAALRVLGSNATYVVYYELLLLLLLVRFGWRRRRAQWGKLILRYALAGLILAPLLLPFVVAYPESLRAHFRDFGDWHLRRAYNFRNYWLTLPYLWEEVLVPGGVWLAAVASAVLLRGRVGPFTQVLAGFFAFGLLYSLRYSPVWFLGSLVPGIRIPQWIFEPLTWLPVLAVAEAVHRARGMRARPLLLVIFVASLASCLWQTRLDPARAYISPLWQRSLPERLAAQVRREPRFAAIFPTGPDRKDDDQDPILNSNHNLILRVRGGHYLGEMPSVHYARATYRVPGLLFMQRMATPLMDWDTVVDVYAELGIAWVFWDGAGEPVHPRLRFSGEEHGFRLYRITAARPRIYALDAVRRVERPTLPAGVSALVFSLPALGPFCYGCPEGAAASPVGEVRLRSRWRPGDVEVEVDSPRGTLVVLGETRSRGWSATVDDRSAVIYPMNELFQAVAVPAGRRRIRWHFTSPELFAGLGMAAVGLAAVIAAPWVSSRRRSA